MFLELKKKTLKKHFILVKTKSEVRLENILYWTFLEY